MSRMKKIGIRIFIIMLVALGMCNLSNAADYKLGNKVYINYMNDYAADKNMFCAEKSQGFGAYYRVVSKVTINGIQSKDYTNKTIDNVRNAKFAYILSSADDYPYMKNGQYIEAKENSVLQKAVWLFEREWMQNVGKYHYKQSIKNGKNVNTSIGMDFISSNPKNYTTTDKKVQELIGKANNYANNIQKQSKFTDNTKKNNIAVKTYEKSGKKYLVIGDFNWSFEGKLKQIKAYDQNNNEIKGISYIKYNSNTPQEVSIDKIESGKNFGIAIPEGANVSYLKKLTGVQEISNRTVEITFLESIGNVGQNLIHAKPSQSKNPVEVSFNYNVPLLGDLKIIKVDKENKNIKLNGVGFYIQNTDTKKYVVEENKQIKYVDSKEGATVFCTENGEFTVKNLIVGNYKLYETKNPNDGYKEGLEIPVKVEAGQTAKNTFTVENEREFIKLSGYVWVDRISGKQSTRNNLYHDGEYDSDDMLLEGITVRLKQKDGTTSKTIKETKTSKEGAYQFKDVLIKDLDKYYIEFEYNGLTYQNVPSKLDKNNGSKSAEGDKVRNEFNKDFAIVEGETANTGITKDEQGNVKHKLSYTRPENEHKSELNDGDYPILATTEQTGYKIKDHYTPGQNEIKYINLGLYEREMPDILLKKDLENIELSINGFGHVYEYGGKKLDDYKMEIDERGFNVGVKFGSKYTGIYRRAVYKPDYNYTIANKESDNRLKVYLTYRIAMYNESTSLKAKVNSVVDYYDKNFTLETIGTGINKETGAITGDIAKPQTEPDLVNGYNKVVIQNNTEIDAQKSNSIYVRFRLSDEEILKAFNDRDGKVTYKNIAEVNSYSIFDDKGNIYAGIDKDSAPANATPGDNATYEDDTDQDLGVQLEVQGERTISGSVFLDESEGEIGKVRLGNGIFDTGENGIEGVSVTLRRDDGTEFYATTGSDGGFKIKDDEDNKKYLIPGNYTLTYTWGDTTYTVKDFKGTIWTPENRTEKEQNGVNWYKVNKETRYSDAMDNWETRQKIDAGEDIKTMDSTTPSMALGLEINSVYSVVDLSNPDSFHPEGYEIEHIDFGIVERARQQLDINKRVKTFKVTLANGQVIVDAQVNYKADGTSELVGNKDNVTYMAPETTTPTNGQLWLQLDNELIQGAKVEVEYEIKVINNSEIDYNTEGYYKFGTDRTNIITITPKGVYDYLDGMVMNQEEQSKDSNNGTWEVISKEEYNRTYEKEPTIVEKYFKDEYNNFVDANGNIVNTHSWEVANEIYQEIYTEWAYSTIERRQVVDLDAIREEKLKNKTILHNAKLEETLAPIETEGYKNENSVKLNTSVILSNSNEIDLNNDVEITKYEYKPDGSTGRIITPKVSRLMNRGQEITITPPTGENNNIVLIIATTVSALVLLGVGVFIIKRKAL